ncbi:MULTISPECIES: RNA polymerase sigma factor [unclassified Coleofasciculus]|uniref:RNA polymerase sigma factor n=1 Tax=unclassified Coleofasciculus TaxID=2692782 RepID=UPI001882A4CA|nr:MULTISPECIES: sigma-70 family RNA polymerase sigma factor [unclassified Coleofasciculus]MBE9126366.1 sigma-70 family RNA polymerase sigma factor [Coleofasciculus sp. LEGE 07081]MBE9150019.1 sigma-70 family RNA polymerase sigma factor [Coleofasciculus sp. LEGE 07092]
MHIPHFSESNHPFVKSLFHYSDRELLTLFQRHPEQGKYFTAIFCRYSPIVYTLVRHSARSPVQADYLFAMTWRHMFYELRGLDLREDQTTESSSFQNWLINMTAVCINQAELPSVESIHYDLKAAPPPLWCYLEQALDKLRPGVRLMTVMAQTFHWSETRIAAYLQAEGEPISPAQVRTQLQQGYQILEADLPEDIRVIYLRAQVTPPVSESQPDAVPI